MEPEECRLIRISAIKPYLWILVLGIGAGFSAEPGEAIELSSLLTILRPCFRDAMGPHYALGRLEAASPKWLSTLLPFKNISQIGNQCLVSERILGRRLKESVINDRRDRFRWRSPERRRQGCQR